MLACSPLAKRMLRKLGWNKEVHKMSRKLSEDLHNPYLFSEYKAGEYEYEVSADGKSATGSLKIAEDPERDSKAQSGSLPLFRHRTVRQLNGKRLGCPAGRRRESVCTYRNGWR